MASSLAEIFAQLPDIDFNPVLSNCVSSNPSQIQVQGISDDSRTIVKGELYLAVKGGNFDGHAALADVESRGAVAALVDSAAVFDKSEVSMPLFGVANLAKRRGEIASAFFASPSKELTVIAVTGTNGKTSCSEFVASALTSLESRCAMIGTMGYGEVGHLVDPGLTTPDALKVQRILNVLCTEKFKAVCLEASSHGIAQHRLEGCDIDIAVFTNISRDHLDYHATFDDYQNTKASLFTQRELGCAIVNLDDDFGSQLCQRIAQSQVETKIICYSQSDKSADIYCKSVEFLSKGMDLKLVGPFGEISFKTAVIGAFNVSNLLAVTAVLSTLGYSAEQIEKTLAGLSGVKGRMELLEIDVGPNVVIDYAHTPDALEKAIMAVRLHSNAAIWTVMGCGGDRDKGKRPEMGAIAEKLSDHLIITDDNPRTESSSEIIRDVVNGLSMPENVMIEADRKKAIQLAISSAANQDIVLIAGKGHEDYQDIGGVKQPFSDHLVVEELQRTGDEPKPKAIIGLGKTGLACADHFSQQGIAFSIFDDALQPERIATLSLVIDDTHLVDAGPIDTAKLLTSSEIILSPGVPLSHPSLQAAKAAGVNIIGDIGLFMDLVDKPVVAVTGSNGKSTVVDLLGHIFKTAGLNVGVGGNFGTPCLELLALNCDIYVLELSSYQLELLDNLTADVALLLNLSPDHLDRYPSLADYYETKLKVYRACQTAVVNRDIGAATLTGELKTYTFGRSAPEDDDALGIVSDRSEGGTTHYLAMGDQRIMPTSDLMLPGRHNWQNALAAIAVARLQAVEMEVITAALKTYTGLAHRCEFAGDYDGVDYYNDSKSTNPGSTLAAISGFTEENQNLYLIMGGEAKDADFSSLSHACETSLQGVSLFGRDAEVIAEQLGKNLSGKIGIFATLEEVVQDLKSRVIAGDKVLFSPACASFDQFKNYEHRGNAFKAMLEAFKL